MTTTMRMALQDAAVAVAAGYLATRMMEPVSSTLYEWEPAPDRAREDAARPGPPYRTAAQKTTDLIGRPCPNPALDRAGLLFHYGLAITWAPVYQLLRRATRLGRLGAGLAAGASMSLIADELLTPTLGFSAPNRAYPLATHAGGLLAHLVYGLAVATVVETGWALLRRRR